jgi:hypothetical protein
MAWLIHRVSYRILSYPQLRLAALNIELACEILVIHCFFMLAVAAFTEMTDSP